MPPLAQYDPYERGEEASAREETSRTAEGRPRPPQGIRRPQRPGADPLRRLGSERPRQRFLSGGGSLNNPLRPLGGEGASVSERVRWARLGRLKDTSPSPSLTRWVPPSPHFVRRGASLRPMPP